jgi:hypothetical protein
MKELVYSREIFEEIVKKYPTTKWEDASDDIHTERYEIEIPDVTEQEFYPIAMEEDWADACFGFCLELRCGTKKEWFKKMVEDFLKKHKPEVLDGNS